MSEGRDRRLAKRSYGRFTVRVALEARSDGSVQSHATGWLTDASFSGCCVVCSDLPEGAREKLQSGEWNVRVNTHWPRDGAELSVSGRVKWLEPHPQAPRQSTIGVQYLLPEADQQQLASLLREQQRAGGMRPLGWLVPGVILLAAAGWWVRSQDNDKPSVVASAATRRSGDGARDLDKPAVTHQQANDRPGAPVVSPPSSKPARSARSILGIDPQAPKGPDPKNLAPLSSQSAELSDGVLSFRAELVYPAPASTLWKVAVVDAKQQIVQGCSRLVLLATGANSFSQACEPAAGEWLAPFSLQVSPATPPARYLVLPPAEQP